MKTTNTVIEFLIYFSVVKTRQNRWKQSAKSEINLLNKVIFNEEKQKNMKTIKISEFY